MKKQNTKNIVVSLFDYTGNMLKPWADAGYVCYAVDLQHNEDLQHNKKKKQI